MKIQPSRCRSPSLGREPLGLSKTVDRASEVDDGGEGVPELEAKVDRQLHHRAILQSRSERGQSLLEVSDRLSIGTPGRRLGTRLAEVGHRLVSQLRPQRVVGQPLDVLVQPIAVEPLDRVHDPGVQSASALLEQAAVRHLVGQRMLERVLQIREEARRS